MRPNYILMFNARQQKIVKPRFLKYQFEIYIDTHTKNYRILELPDVFEKETPSR